MPSAADTFNLAEWKNSGKMSQLFNLDYKENNGTVVFYDSTGKELPPDEIVLLTLSWSLN